MVSSNWGGFGRVLALAPAPPAATRQPLVSALEVQDRDADLLEIVLTLGAVGRLTHLLDGWQQEPDEHSDDGDYDQELDQRETDRSSHGTRDHGRHSDEQRIRGGPLYPTLRAVVYS